MRHFVNSVRKSSSSALLAALAMVVAAGCTQQPERVDSAPPTPTGRQALPARAVYDPPAKFDTQAGVLLPWEATSGLLSVGGTWLGNGRIPVALHKDKVYVATLDRLLAFNTTTGSLTATITPTADALSVLRQDDRNNAAPPAITPGLNPLVLAPFFVRQPGVGTQAAKNFVEFTATNAASDKIDWRLPLALPSWTKEGSPRTVSVVGTSEKVAVVTVSTGESSLFSAATTYGIDLTTRRVLWTKDRFEATAVTGNIVAGELETTDEYAAARGYDLLTGTERWRGEDRLNLDVKPAGPHLLLVQAQNKSDYRVHIRQFLDPATGEVKHETPDDFIDSRCDHDGQNTVVCSWDQGNLQKVWAFNDRTASLLWQLPDQTANRIAPQVTAVWNGRIYGKTNDGPLALDSQTGADLPTRPGAAPFLVNGYTGLALSPFPEDDLTAYPATE
ncbi:hypothetical protein ACFQ7J_14345 [Streptomyces sp. NPDC056501]|uniref:hypothetical protein n=1 Tax=Streptomyces sp. NPDC056501 TaxID=3345841 RepID=UPI0036A290D4